VKWERALSAWPYWLALLGFVADRLSKLWAAQLLAENGTTQIHAWLIIRETYNRGVAFGLFRGIGPLIGWLSVAVVVVLLVYLRQVPPNHWITRLGMALLIGGATGNLIDRIMVGEVLDFIDTPLRVSIFNLADIQINLGMGLMLLGAFVEREPHPAPASSDSAQQANQPDGAGDAPE
jgi:signal peptidase II